MSDILLPLDGLDQRSGGQEVPWCTKLEPVHYCWRRIVYFFPFYLRSKSWTRESDGPDKNTGHLGLFLLPAVHGAEAVPWCFLLTGRGVQRGAGALPANCHGELSGARMACMQMQLHSCLVNGVVTSVSMHHGHGVCAGTRHCAELVVVVGVDTVASKPSSS